VLCVCAVLLLLLLLASWLLLGVRFILLLTAIDWVVVVVAVVQPDAMRRGEKEREEAEEGLYFLRSVVFLVDKDVLLRKKDLEMGFVCAFRVAGKRETTQHNTRTQSFIWLACGWVGSREPVSCQARQKKRLSGMLDHNSFVPWLSII